MEDTDKGILYALIFFGVTFGILLFISNIQATEYTDKEEFCRDNGYMELAQSRLAYLEDAEYVKCIGYKLIDDRLIEVEEWVRWKP